MAQSKKIGYVDNPVYKQWRSKPLFFVNRSLGMFDQEMCANGFIPHGVDAHAMPFYAMRGKRRGNSGFIIPYVAAYTPDSTTGDATVIPRSAMHRHGVTCVGIPPMTFKTRPIAQRSGPDEDYVYCDIIKGIVNKMHDNVRYPRSSMSQKMLDINIHICRGCELRLQSTVDAGIASDITAYIPHFHTNVYVESAPLDRVMPFLGRYTPRGGAHNTSMYSLLCQYMMMHGWSYFDGAIFMRGGVRAADDVCQVLALARFITMSRVPADAYSRVVPYLELDNLKYIGSPGMVRLTGASFNRCGFIHRANMEFIYNRDTRDILDSMGIASAYYMNRKKARLVVAPRSMLAAWIKLRTVFFRLDACNDLCPKPQITLMDSNHFLDGCVALSPLVVDKTVVFCYGEYTRDSLGIVGDENVNLIDLATDDGTGVSADTVRFVLYGAHTFPSHAWESVCSAIERIDDPANVYVLGNRCVINPFNVGSIYHSLVIYWKMRGVYVDWNVDMLPIRAHAIGQDIISMVHARSVHRMHSFLEDHGTLVSAVMLQDEVYCGRPMTKSPPFGVCLSSGDVWNVLSILGYYWPMAVMTTQADPVIRYTKSVQSTVQPLDNKGYLLLRSTFITCDADMPVSA